MTLELEPIKYRGKTVDTGWVMGRRPWRWTLKRMYSPCWARDLDSGEFVSGQSEHKSNFAVYVPAECLSVGTRIQYLDRPYQGQERAGFLRVVAVGGNYVECEAIEQPKRRSQAA